MNIRNTASDVRRRRTQPLRDGLDVLLRLRDRVAGHRLHLPARRGSCSRRPGTSRPRRRAGVIRARDFSGFLRPADHPLVHRPPSVESRRKRVALHRHPVRADLHDQPGHDSENAHRRSRVRDHETPRTPRVVRAGVPRRTADLYDASRNGARTDTSGARTRTYIRRSVSRSPRSRSGCPGTARRRSRAAVRAPGCPITEYRSDRTPRAMPSCSRRRP